MNPLARKRVETALVDELRLCAGGDAPTKSFLRQSIDCTPAELAAAVQSLRYQGKVMWDRLELSSSMLELNAGTKHPPDASPSSIAGEEPAPGTVVAPIAAEGGVAAAKQTSPPSIAPGPDDEDDEGVNDSGVEQPVARQAHNLEVAGSSPAPATNNADAGFVPKHLLHRAGVHAANTRAGGKPLPPPAHEPEIARLVREEVNEGVDRRARARSTATVRQPLEVRKFGIPDLSGSEAIGCLLTEEPIDVLRAVTRKHPALWRRCVLLARQRGERPIRTLYAALEQGLGELEADHPKQEQADAA